MTQRIASLFVVFGGFVVQGLLMISGIVTARVLGVEGRGEIALVVSLSTMAAQLTLGGSLPNALTNRLASRRLKARDGVGHLVPRWALLAVVSAVPFAVLFAILHGDVAEHGVWALGVCVGVLAIQNMAFRLILAALLGEGAPMSRVAIATLFPQTLVTASMVVLFVTVDRTSSLLVSLVMVVSYGLGLVVGLWALAPASRRADGGTQDRLEGDDLWRLTRSTYVGSIGPIDGLALDRTLVGAIMGTVALGLFSAAAALASLPAMMGTGLATVLLPRVAASQADPAQERALVRRWLVLAASVLAALAGLLALAAEPVIVLAFGEDFRPAVPVARWLVVAAGFLGFRRVLVAVLQGRDRGGVASWVELALTPVLVVGIVLAARADETQGIGIAMLAVGITSVSTLLVLMVRAGRQGPRRPRPGRHRLEQVSPSA